MPVTISLETPRRKAHRARQPEVPQIKCIPLNAYVDSVYYSRERKIKWSFYNEDRLVGSSAGFSSLALSIIRFTLELVLLGASRISGCAFANSRNISSVNAWPTKPA